MRRLAPLALMLLSSTAWAEWGARPTARLDNQLSVAIALRSLDLDPEATRALVAQTGEGAVVRRYDRIRAREHLELTQATSVALMTLDSYATPSAQQSWSFESGEICTRYQGSEAPTTHTRLTALSPLEDSGGGQGAQVFRGVSDEGEQVLTWLHPGETVTMVEAVSEDGRSRVERIELRQRLRTLTLQRDEQGTEACYLNP
ncbi:MAG: hypothetical protein ABIO70_03430 [Pseudomonadota bacterium]